jgi:flagellar basal-body rod protein FlgC
MNLFNVLDVSASALTAERLRAEVISVNMANAETTRTASGGPYVRQQVVFQSASEGPSVGKFQDMFSKGQHDDGVNVAAIVSDTAPPIERFDPQHPDADRNGMVSFPDINPLTEMVDLVSASRAYGLNTSAILATKGMIASSLEIVK